MDIFQKDSKIVAILQRIVSSEEYTARVVAWCLGIPVGSAFFFLLMSALSPHTAEILHSAAVQIGFILTCTLCALFCIVVVSLAAWNMGKGLQIQLPALSELSFTGPKAIGAGAASDPFDISPDILIVRYSDETEAEYLARIQEAREKERPGVWAVAIPYALPVGAIYGPGTPGAGLVFSRENPFDEEELLREKGTDFSRETAREYQAYILDFCAKYRRWATAKKLEFSPSPNTFFAILSAKSAALFFALFFAVGLFAQTKTEALHAHMGDRVSEVPPAGSKVIFMFDGGRIERRGDGQKNFLYLLTGIPAFRDSNEGALRAVTVNNRLVIPSAQLPTNMTGDPVRRTASVYGDHDAPIPTAGDRLKMNIPDSLETERIIEDTKKKVDFYTSTFWKNLRPWWGLVMYVFWALFPICAIAVVVLRVLVKFAANEELPGVHYRLSKSLFWLVSCTWVVFILNALLTLVYWEPGTVGFLLGCVAVYFVATYTASWIVPNIEARDNGRTTFTRPMGQRMLGQ